MGNTVKMKNKEINRSIENYKPHEGFYDLSKVPKYLTKIEWARVIKCQEFIIEQNKNIDYLKRFEKIRYKDLVELTARLQIIIIENWSVQIKNEKDFHSK